MIENKVTKKILQSVTTEEFVKAQKADDFNHPNYFVHLEKDDAWFKDDDFLLPSGIIPWVERFVKKTCVITSNWVEMASKEQEITDDFGSILPPQEMSCQVYNHQLWMTVLIRDDRPIVSGHIQQFGREKWFGIVSSNPELLKTIKFDNSDISLYKKNDENPAIVWTRFFTGMKDSIAEFEYRQVLKQKVELYHRSIGGVDPNEAMFCDMQRTLNEISSAKKAVALWHPRYNCGPGDQYNRNFYPEFGSPENLINKKKHMEIAGLPLLKSFSKLQKVCRDKKIVQTPLQFKDRIRRIRQIHEEAKQASMAINENIKWAVELNNIVTSMIAEL